MNSHILTHCQVCRGAHLESLLFLGYIPLSNTMVPLDQLPSAEWRFPLELVRCKDCTLVQINYSIDPKILFPDDYLYLSGSTKVLRENFIDLKNEVSSLFPPGSFLVDIGANDGSLLIPFREAGYSVLGVEPTQAIENAQRQGLAMIKNSWSLQVAQKILAQYGSAQIITATNVFAHVLPIQEFIQAVLQLLDPRGMFIIECHYLLDLVERLQYDTIYHDHLKYYSVGSLQNLLEPYGLEILRVQKIPTHGGSIRVYTARKGSYPIDLSVSETISKERALGLENGEFFALFRSKVIDSKLSILSLLRSIKEKGGRIYGIGAPSRAITLTHYVGLDDGLLDAVVEAPSSSKVNKWMPGTRIPILEETALFTHQPEYALFYSWHIAEELSEKLKNKGYKGKYIVPLPVPKIY